jgi:hypothetical protein
MVQTLIEQFRWKRLPLFAPRIIASGEAILLNAAILIANEPVSGAKRQDRRGEREELQGLG